MLGFGLVAVGPDCVQWRQLLRIAASWIVSPLIGGALGFAVYRGIRAFVLRHEHPVGRARCVIPVAAGIVIFVVAWSIFESLAPRILGQTGESRWPVVCMALAVAACSGMAARMLIVRQHSSSIATSTLEHETVERYFARLQPITACYMAFAHGANDVANAIGPIAGIVESLKGSVVSSAAVPPWILAFGGAGIVIGLGTYGYKVIETIGRKITEVTPTRGFSAELGTASTVLLCSLLGFPISTTFVLIGALMGVGFARGFGVIDLKIVRNIFMSWLITIPISAILSAAFFLVLRSL